MKKIVTLTAGVLLGLNISLAGMAPVTTAYAEPQEQEMTAVKSTDNSIFKTAQLRPDYVVTP